MKTSLKNTGKLILLIGLLFSILTGCSDNLRQKYVKYNVIWDSQSEDSWGSMPIGNGDIGANVWVTADGELQFFISKTDAFSENARLLKIGKVKVKFTPNILSGKNFKQELDLYSGKIKISAEEPGQKMAFDFWIDANNPAIVIDGKCDIPVKMEVSYEGWRNKRRQLTQKEMFSAYGLYGSPDPVYVEPDTILRRQAELLWCHHNKRSIWKNVLELQALGELTHQLNDPLLNRTFGALVYGKNLKKESDIKLVSGKPDKKFNVSIIVNTEFAENTAAWAQNISDLKMEIEKQPIAKRKQAHDNWWKSFCNRHYLFIDSKTQPEETFTVTSGYLLQRYINACGGRGKLPIKFNGSIFTVDVVRDIDRDGVNLKGMDADYRAWGGGYWWQNTRLPYWSMLYSGNFEMMKPLFNMYIDALPILKNRTRKYYGHDGAFCSETMYFWGTYNNANYGWNREDMPDGLTENMYIRYYWQSGIELIAMMQDYYLFTGDTDFLNSQLIVFASEILTFYNEHYQKDEAGKIVIYPSESLETYWEGTINPLPEIAGLKFITERFMKMDKLTGDNPFISLCETVRNSLPAIPVRQDDDGQQLLSPAQELTWEKHNSENPELYAVFPYRLFGQGKNNLDLARNTFDKRLHKQFSGWQQDAIQAALLGLTGEAQRMIVHNFSEKHEGSRFPAFWGPNVDWIPDQDHGTVNTRALQNMLIQDIDDKIHLFPAWPQEWNVTFKVHAPQNTVIKGKWEDGKLKNLMVVPEKRDKDIIIRNETVPAKTYCNPTNLNYRFQLDKPSRREAADPAVIFFKEEYYLFASKSGGYWNSTDLVNWKFIPVDDLPTEDYAPAVVSIGDTMYFVASSHDKMPIYKTADPKSGKWDIANPEFPFPIWDPAFFQDDDGRLYLYWGCSNKAPLYAIELDPENNLNPIGDRVICFGADIEQHGWETRGDFNELNENPWLEGAWMNKYNDKYYLQYSAPGTEMRSYADGVYTASSPLGPFKYASYSPFSRKARGFVTGTGHGCTFTDKYGNYWHATTMVICVKQMFERRLCIFPAGFDKDGVLYAQTAFGDYPHYMPDGKSDFVSENTFTDWMLLSYKKQANSSSVVEGYPADQAFDEDIKTYWAAQSGKDEWLSANLEKKCRISAVQVNFAEHETNLFDRQPGIYYQYLIEYSNDGKQWKILVDKTSNKTDCPHDYVQLDTPVKARYIKLKVLHIPDGRVAVSGLRVFGNGMGEKPGIVESFTVVRNEKDTRAASITWDTVPDATGYIIRYGTEKNRLYNQFMVYRENRINIKCLNKGVDYFFSIDSFNENGVTSGDRIIEQLIRYE